MKLCPKFKARNVWTMIDVAEVKLNVPMMNSSSKCATFATFFSKVRIDENPKNMNHEYINS